MSRFLIFARHRLGASSVDQSPPAVQLERDGWRRRQVIGGAVATALLPWVPAARACEFFTDTLRVTHPWVRATRAGDTSAVFGMTLDQVQRPDRLIGVRTPVAGGAVMAGAKAGMPVDLRIEPGQTLELGEHGQHLRLTPLLRELQPGREFELELHFDSGVLLATLTVEVPTMRFR